MRSEFRERAATRAPKAGLYSKRGLLIGWDTADWKIIAPLIARGGMPSLKRLIDRGVRGDLRSLDPKLSPLLWTCIATGKTADKHGILHSVEPGPETGSLRDESIDRLLDDFRRIRSSLSQGTRRNKRKNEFD